MVTPRRIRCLAALAALLPLATLTAPAPASAQPACVAGVLSAYLSLTGGCTIGGVTFTDFQGRFTAVGTVALLSHVDVTPFSAGDQIGFSLVLDQPLSVLVDYGTVNSFPQRRFEFDFTASGVGPGGLLGVTPFSLFTASVAAAGIPAPATFAHAGVEASSVATGHSVSVDTRQVNGSPQMSDCTLADPLPHPVPCVPLVTTDFADGPVTLVGTVEVLGDAEAPASASLRNMSVAIVVPPATPAPPTVTPEPAPMTLVASGFGLLGLVGVRRRRRSGHGSASQRLG
ncbi:MAG TPA: hypothetical protein VFS08_02750 [Gemmatimonadaceae bacterium]|nr:hypothetical protein [Gemmatimonadaceae bacterium]